MDKPRHECPVCRVQKVTDINEVCEKCKHNLAVYFHADNRNDRLMAVLEGCSQGRPIMIAVATHINSVIRSQKELIGIYLACKHPGRMLHDYNCEKNLTELYAVLGPVKVDDIRKWQAALKAHSPNQKGD